MGSSMKNFTFYFDDRVCAAAVDCFFIFFQFKVNKFENFGEKYKPTEHLITSLFLETRGQVKMNPRFQATMLILIY